MTYLRFLEVQLLNSIPLKKECILPEKSLRLSICTVRIHNHRLKNEEMHLPITEAGADKLNDALNSQIHSLRLLAHAISIFSSYPLHFIKRSCNKLQFYESPNKNLHWNWKQNMVIEAYGKLMRGGNKKPVPLFLVFLQTKNYKRYMKKFAVQ